MDTLYIRKVAPLVSFNDMKTSKQAIDLPEPADDEFYFAAHLFTMNGAIDTDGDSYAPGLLDDNPPNTDDNIVRIREMHDRSKTIGFGLEFDITETKADMTAAVIYTSITDGANAKTRVLKAIYPAVSVGFQAIKYAVVDDDDRGRWGYGFEFQEIKLNEVSLVDVPAVSEATIISYKNKKNEEVILSREEYSFQRSDSSMKELQEFVDALRAV